MAILFQTAKFKSANAQFGGKPLNLMTANISGYTVEVLRMTPLRLRTRSDISVLENGSRAYLYGVHACVCLITYDAL